MSTTTEENKPIIIDLSESQSAVRFEGEGEKLLQQTALKQVKDIIKELAGKVAKLKHAPSADDGADHHSHDVITINGERGSGKTTFILNILGLVSKESGKDCRIKSLGIIDPTLIEDCEHIFLAVISKIKEAVENHWEDSRIGSKAETVDERHTQWRNSLTKLAGGLRNLGKNKDMDGDSWSDPQFIMEQGLENSAQGVKLALHFHCFVEESLRFVDADAFIIALDDVDTKVETGWPVLEVLRKYLTTPRLMVILSGDIELYTLLIFNQQCKQIGVKPEKIIEKKEEGINKQRKFPEEYAGQRDLVNSLTEQYMMKIMRPDYRIEMQTVVQITKQKGRLVKVRYGAGEDREIEVLLKEFCKEIYGSDFQVAYLAEVLMDVPTRTCIKLLNIAAKYLESSGKLDASEKKIAHFEAIVGLGHVFQNSLSRADLSSKLINEIEAELHMNLGYLAVALQRKELLEQGFHLFPLQAKAWQRQLMMVLGAVYSRALTKQPAMLFGYLVNMCLPAYLQGVLKANDSKDIFVKYIEASQLETEQEPINSVKRGTKYLLEQFQSNKNTIHNRPLNHYLCAFPADDCLTITSWHRYLLNMITVFAEEGESTSHRYISFYCLIGAIGTLAGSIKKSEKGLDTNQTKDEADRIKAVRLILQQYGEDAANLKFGGNGSSDYDKNEEASTDDSQNEFCKLFATWCWTLPEYPAPVLALTESWTRFLKVTTRLAEKYDREPGKDGCSQGDYLQDCIIYYLSNLLEYEMSIVGIESKSGNHENIEVKFVNLLNAYFDPQRYKPESLKCRFFEYIFSCPIWMHFMHLPDQRGPQEIIFSYYASCLDKVSPGANPVKIANLKAGEEECSNLFQIMNKKKESPGAPE